MLCVLIVAKLFYIALPDHISSKSRAKRIPLPVAGSNKPFFQGLSAGNGRPHKAAMRNRGLRIQRKSVEIFPHFSC